MADTGNQRTAVDAPNQDFGDSADKAAADLLNSAIRKSKSPSTSTRLVAGLWGLISGTPQGKRQRQEVQQGVLRYEGVEDQEESEANGVDHAHAKSAETASTTRLWNGVQSPDNRRKRKQPPQRPDEYEVPVSGHKLAEEEGDVNPRPRKQVKRSARRKSPITLPRTSKGHFTRSKQIEDAAGTISRIEVRIPALDNGEKSPDHSRTSQHSNNVPAAREIPVSTPSTPKVAEPRLQQHTLQSEGDTSLFLSPSPKKVIKPALLQKPAPMTAETRAVGEESATSGFRVPSSNDENSDLSDTSQTDRDIFDIKVLKSMLVKSKRVGSNYNREEDVWQSRKTQTIVYTILGKRIMRHIKCLLAEYSVLKTSKNLETSGLALDTQSKITGELKAIKDNVNEILTTRLGNPAKQIAFLDDKPTVAILTDLYFHIIPSMLETILAASDAYTLQISIETGSLQDIFDLVDMLRQLAETARQQRVQPLPTTEKGIATSKSQSYQVAQPTRTILVDLRKFWRSLSAELKRRTKQEADEEERTSRLKLEKATERARRRQEREEENEKRQRITQIHKSQSQNMLKQLADPVWGQILAASIIEEESKLPNSSSNTALLSRRAAGTQRVGYSRSREIRYNSQRSAKSGSASGREFPRNDADDYQRVSVFGNTNTGQQNKPSPWSGQEKTLFIEFLQLNKGQDRYERLAEILERSIEEIFAYAKDLQEAMDHAHENGMFNDVCDEWTYDVWIDPKQPY